MSTSPQTRVALITGSGRRRVGNVVATFLAKRGYSIALHYHSSSAAAQTAVQEIRALGVECEAYQANVAESLDVDAMIDQVRTIDNRRFTGEALTRLTSAEIAEIEEYLKIVLGMSVG